MLTNPLIRFRKKFSCRKEAKAKPEPEPEPEPKVPAPPSLKKIIKAKYKLKIHCKCEGCDRKVQKVLKKFDGVQKFKFDIYAEPQWLKVTGVFDHEKLLKALQEKKIEVELHDLTPPSKPAPAPAPAPPAPAAAPPAPAAAPPASAPGPAQPLQIAPAYLMAHPAHPMAYRPHPTMHPASSSSSYLYEDYSHMVPYEQNRHWNPAEERLRMFNDENPEACSVM